LAQLDDSLDAMKDPPLAPSDASEIETALNAG
jgi:hypothetical protein